MKVLIVDDQKKDVERILKKLEACQFDAIEQDIYVFSDLHQLDIDLKIHTFDLAYLDIELGQISGLLVAQRLVKKNPRCIIVFVTNHNQYICDALELPIFQFIPKPLLDEKFDKIYYQAVETYKKYHSRVLFNTNSGKKQFNPFEISYIETYYNYLKIINSYDTYYSNIKNLKMIKHTLKPFDFIQVHQSYFVNMNYIKKIESNCIILNNGQEVPMALGRKKEVKKQYEAFMFRGHYHDELE